MLFRFLMRQIIDSGSLTIIAHDGRQHSFGDGTGLAVTVRMLDAKVSRELALNPYLKLGEAYMDGRISVDPPATIYDLLDLITRNTGQAYATPIFEAYGALRRFKRRIDQHNPVGKAQKNVAHHYDIEGAIYDLFLDEDKQYSCAYFGRPDMTLEEAQLAKKRHIAAKLDIKAGMKVLDIGCGWGGMALTLAEETGAEVVGVTLSEAQHRIATQRAKDRGLSDRVQFHLKDYRLLNDSFDRIVSVGMFEHVGVGHYKEYFNGVKRLLKPDGIALIHTIGRLDGPGATNPWIAKYIFPGGYIPAFSEMAQVVERTGLFMTDLEILRLHYAETLREWRRRFMSRRAEAVDLLDERFARMWEFYLSGSETSFRNEGFVVFQLQLTKSIEALPLTRDYMFEGERHLNAMPASKRQMASD
ncbi:MAG: methyltransferase domain-containing protein [Rhizobiales bacterium]|nr:methyltransferase domain-containing protein [Hyphomicrobiales bacterium]